MKAVTVGILRRFNMQGLTPKGGLRNTFQFYTDRGLYQSTESKTNLAEMKASS